MSSWTTTVTIHFKTATTLILCISIILFASCASKENPEKQDSSGSNVEPVVVVPVETAEPEEKVPAQITVTTKKTGNFYLSDPSVLSDIEKGTPDSLKNAVSKLKRTDDNYSDDEATLMLIASAIMSYAWPQHKSAWVNPVRQPVNGYLEILNSLKQGVYDSPSDSSSADFLTLTLPSLLLCTNSTSTIWYDECRSDLSSALERNPDSPLSWYLISLLEQRIGNNAEALIWGEKVYAALPDAYETGYLYSSLLYANGNFSKSLTVAETLLKREVLTTDVTKLCARSAFSAGLIDAADSYVVQVLQREPENESFLLLRARILYEKGEFLNATSLLDAYAKRNTTNLDYLLLRTRLYQNWTKNNNAALSTISQALALYPDDHDVLLLATEIAMTTGLSVGGRTGRQLLEQLERIDPDNRVTLTLLVNQAVLEENWEKAYTASSALVPQGSLDNLITHISICLNTNHLVEAESLVVRLYDEYPSDETIQQQYIRVLISSGRSAQALVLIEKLLPSAQGKLKSSLYYEKSRLESSKENQLADLRSALTANPRNQEALFSLYEYYFEKSDYRKAQYYLKQLIALNSGNTRYLALNTQLDSLVNNRSN